MSDPFVPLTQEEIESLQPAVVKLLREAGRKYPCHDESEFLNQVDDLFTMALASLSLPSPCGHPSQYVYSEDGGAHMVCLLCERVTLSRPEELSATPFLEAALRFAKAHVHSDSLDDRFDEREADEAQGEYEAADREYNASKKALVAAYRSLTPSDIAAATMADLYPVGTGVLSKDVDCPWCIAKAGEDCYLQGERGSMYRSSTHVHLCRIKPAEKERNEST